MKVTRIGAIATDTGDRIQVKIINRCEDTGELVITECILPYTYDQINQHKTILFSSEALEDLCKLINQPVFETIFLPKL